MISRCVVLALLFVTGIVAFAAEDSAPERSYHRNGPAYQLIRPQWGVEVAGSSRALGTSSTLKGSAKVIGISIRPSFQPIGIQKYGVFSVGPTFNIYLPSPRDTKVWNSWSLGAEIRYQARYFREQILVPYAGYAFEYIYYAPYYGKAIQMTGNGLFYGAMLLLNWFDSDSAADIYVNYGIVRTYAVFEIRTIEGTKARTVEGVPNNITIVGPSFFFGLRFEF